MPGAAVHPGDVSCEHSNRAPQDFRGSENHSLFLSNTTWLGFFPAVFFTENPELKNLSSSVLQSYIKYLHFTHSYFISFSSTFLFKRCFFQTDLEIRKQVIKFCFNLWLLVP